jgi:hypothetical protein
MKLTKEFKNIPNFEGRYSATKDGKIYSNISNMYLKLKIKVGYQYVNLTIPSINGVKQHQYRVSRLIALTFLHNPKNLPQVNHKDGNKLNNKVENLEWCSPSENILHAYKNSLNIQKRGEFHHLAKLSNKEIKEIKELLKLKVKQYKIAEKYNVNSAYISMINTNKRRYYV